MDRLRSRHPHLDPGIEFVECTGLSPGENLPFSTAREVGEKRWQNEPIRFCLDVKTAWLTAPGWEIQSYLRAMREQLGRLPQMWYPSDTDFSQVRMRVQARQERRQYDEERKKQRSAESLTRKPPTSMMNLSVVWLSLSRVTCQREISGFSKPTLTVA